MDYHPNFPPSLSIAPNVSRLTNNSPEGHAFGVEAQREAISRYGIAGRVWEAAYPLCAYIDPPDEDPHDFDPPFVDEPREHLGVIELGSGTGVVAASIARIIRQCSRQGGFVVATDLPEVCPLLRYNLGLGSLTPTEGNRSELDAVLVQPLAWGNRDHAIAIAGKLGPQRRLTHVVCSDLVYFPELLGPLLRTLIHLTSPACVPSSGPSVKVVISYKIRSLPKETPFWSAFGLWFSFQPILAHRLALPSENRNTAMCSGSGSRELWRPFGAGGDTERTFLFVAHRRPESIAWHVAETDQELMEGVGARGTPAKKGDDTFETILFMSMGIDNIDESP